MKTHLHLLAVRPGIRKAIAGLLLASLIGCSNPGIVQLSPDSYMLSRSSAAGAFANVSKMKADALSEASAFAQKQGKVAVPSSLHENRPSVGFPTVDLTFTTMTRAAYERQQREKQKDWSSLTPAQRAAYVLQTQEMEQRDRAIATQERIESSATLGRALDRNSYDERTRAIKQPINLNVSGDVNHNVRILSER